MAGKSISAFNREYHFPHLQVFTDRNRVEKQETFKIPAAARDRFIMELNIETPESIKDRKTLVFDPRFHNVDQLLQSIRPDILPFDRLNRIETIIQEEITASETLQNYTLDLWEATRDPSRYGASIDGINMDRLVAHRISLSPAYEMRRESLSPLWSEVSCNRSPLHDTWLRIGYRSSGRSI